MFSCRLVDRPERSEVTRLLRRLGRSYPGGLTWLDRRLDDVEAGRAVLWQAMRGPDLAGLALCTPKGAHQEKLSTFMVDPRFRREGLGRALIGRLQTSWSDRDIDEVRMTVDSQDAATWGFFQAHGFEPVGGASVDYGGGRIDLVLRWRAERVGDLATAVH
jgi:ribosomal protein S18 acetylase RimI-like enzyme